MDNNEAIQVFTKWAALVNARIANGDKGGNLSDLIIVRMDAVRIAVEAIGKQIPKPVKYLNRHGDGADLWNKDYFNCPACGRRLRNKKPDPYCPRCGQALTWEVTV